MVNESLIGTTVVALIGSLGAWVMNSLSQRITKLEDTHDKKVNKDDHNRDLDALREEMGNLRDDIRDLSHTIRALPDQIFNTLQRIKG